jgi:hypothetical protein
MFNITAETMSYRFLVRWNEKIKTFDSDKKYFDYRFPRTFCEYYRMVILTVLKLLAFGVVTFALVPYAIYDAIYGISQVGLFEHFVGLTVVGSAWPMQVAFFFGLLGLFVYTAFGLAFGVILVCTWIAETYETLKEKYGKDKLETLKKQKEPSFFAVARDAYKNKFCPMVTFVSKEEIEDEHAN